MCCFTCDLVASMSLPYSTPDGHASSQARHCKHMSQGPTTEGLISSRPSFTPFISAMRPRGDSASSPVSKYVGQA